jgi:drug/metabolite transporter (DMT)-like permease
MGVAFVNLAAFTWATNMVLGRSLRDEIGPFTLAAVRFSIASIVFSILLWRRPLEEQRLGPDRWRLLVMAFIGVVSFAPTLYLGLRYTLAVNATLINGFGPLITGIFAALLIREPMSRRQVSGAVFGLTGVVVLISGGTIAVWETVQGNVGDLIVLGSVALWGLYSVLARRMMRHRSALSTTAFSAFLGLPFLLIAAALELQSFPIHARPGLILSVLYIGVAPTVVGFLSWNAGVRRLGPSGAMVFYNMLPLYGALLGVLFLDEAVGLTHLFGGLLIIGGGLWAARQRT